MTRLSRAAILLAAASIVPVAGCGSGAPNVSSSTQEVTVKGTVTINGKPATSGEVIFDPSNVYRKFVSSKSAAIGADGSYTLTTLYGENKVSVWAPDLKPDVAPPKPQVTKSAPRTKAVPPQFARGTTSAPKAGPKGSLKANVMEVFVEDGDKPINVAVP
ncbi:hypothetical protein [Singulisphaera sp. PoT]|uniref:hypothetical protein n=1 Tax=Singulisphaera sp. PoT TaxID=3411797 RepID=UPI003BF50360